MGLICMECFFFFLFSGSFYSFDIVGCILLRYADATTRPVSLSISYFPREGRISG